MGKFFKSKLKVTSKHSARPMDEVQKEYMQCACDLGNVEYQIKMLEVQKGSIVSRMSELSLEATAINQKESQDGKSSSESNGSGSIEPS